MVSAIFSRRQVCRLYFTKFCGIALKVTAVYWLENADNKTLPVALVFFILFTLFIF